MKKKQKEIAQLGNLINGIMNCKRNRIVKEGLLITALINFAKIEDDHDKKIFAAHVLNLKKISS